MTDGRLSRVPNAPKTPLKSFRIPPDLYDEAKRYAVKRGTSLSEVVRAALEQFVRAERRRERRERRE